MAKEQGITIQLERVLQDFTKEEEDIVYKCIGKAAKFAKREIIANAPELSGDYKRGWTVRTTRKHGSVESVIYNKDKPGLTHILEKSHVIKNKNGTYGRTSPGHGQVEHIGPARDAAEEYLLRLLTEAH